MAKINRRTLVVSGTAFALAPAIVRAQKKYDPGVTDKEIKLGHTNPYSGPLSAYGVIGKGITAYWQMVNDQGGINGRKIVPVYKKYPPILGQKPDPLTLCTSFTEDDKVFAVVGVFIDFTGQAQECVTKKHNTIHIGHEIDLVTAERLQVDVQRKIARAEQATVLAQVKEQAA